MPAWHEDDRFWTDVGAFIFRDAVRAAAAEEAGQIVALLNLTPPARILDMPCGVGRHALELARLGFEVTGVDRTESYLKQAEAGGPTERVRWVRADMREFPHDPGDRGAFDAAINIYTSFGYFENAEDDRLVAAHFFAALKPGGRALFEMIDRDLLLARFRSSEWSEEPGGALVLQQRTLSPDARWIDNRWLIIKGQERREIRFGHRLYGRRDLSDLLGSVGFTIDRVCGSLSGAEQSAEAPRLVMVARRPPT